MPRLPIDYSKTMMYKIVCKNENIKDVYVGHTTNWSKRKNCHHSDCTNENSKHYNYPLYIFIRNNGNWENFDMILIEEYSCENKLYALQRERYWIETLHATLNSRIPSRTIQQYYNENAEQILEKNKLYREQNKEKISIQRAEYRNENREIILEKKRETIVCECGAEINKDHLARHRRTKKHLQNLNN